MLGKIAGFELRYQATSPLYLAAAALLFLGALADMAGIKLVTVGGGNVLFNSPHGIIVQHLLASFLFLFVGAAFVSNVIVRDDQSGFGPIIRATPLTKVDYLLGRFLGAFGAAALIMVLVSLGGWIGTMMPFADAAMLGPTRPGAYAVALGLFALPNAFIIAATLFALATATRSTAGTFFGVIGLLTLYFLSQGLMQNQPDMQSVRVLADPLGMSAYMAGSRYFTANELNAGLVPVSALMGWSRALWVGIAAALLVWTIARFRFAEKPVSRRKLRKQAQLDVVSAPTPSPFPTLAVPRFDRRTAWAQFLARTGMEMRHILRSPAFAILLLIAAAATMPGLTNPSSIMGAPLYPVTTVLIPILDTSFRALLLVIAAYYGGELVWRERERKVDAIIDSAPLPAWTLMLPKMLALCLVLVATLAVGMAAAMAVQAIDGSVAIAPTEYVRWFLLPGAVDTALVAVMAVFIQALSPSKYAGWGVMAAYILLLLFGPSIGLAHPLLTYGRVPDVVLTGMNGAGLFDAAAWWLRLFWAAVAVGMLVVVQAEWPRGTAQPFGARLRGIRSRVRGGAGWTALGAAAVAIVTGGWIAYNTAILNPFPSAAGTERYLAEYERRYLAFARLPQPVVRQVDLDVALYPELARAEVQGRYRLVNRTPAVIRDVHVRIGNPNLELLALDFPGARLVRDDKKFDYRIYRLDRAMMPGEERELSFRTRRRQQGFRAAGTETELAANGTDVDSFDLTPRIGMTDAGLLDNPDSRARQGLPPTRPMPRLEDEAAAMIQLSDNAWITADVTVTTDTGQVPIAPGRKVADRTANGRRTARFVSDTPIKNNLPILSARYAERRERQGPIDFAVFHHPGHAWNVDRLFRTMKASMATFEQSFGPYQFAEARMIEVPAYRDGGHAYPNMLAVGENGAFTMDLRDPAQLDIASLMTAHELSHQWWGHQVVAARMQGAGFLTETLAQYSALMVMKRLYGEEALGPYFAFQRDRYLGGRRTQVLGEEPLTRVEVSQQYVAYGKGALAMYLLQQQMGEEAVNRALRRYVARYRFAPPPYPRSVDLIAMLRSEAKTADQQALITDLFERITLYDLRIDTPRATRRADGRWDVVVRVSGRKLYADGAGAEREAPLSALVPLTLVDDAGRTMMTKAVRLTSGRQVLRVVSARKPAQVAIDRNGLFLDRNAADNSAVIG